MGSSSRRARGSTAGPRCRGPSSRERSATPVPPPSISLPYQLPREKIYSRVDGVWNLSSDQGNLGSFFVTNIRVVWHAQLAENFNVSMPYVQARRGGEEGEWEGSSPRTSTYACLSGKLGMNTLPFSSLPFGLPPPPQMKSVRVRDSKFGAALVVETSARSGAYMLGFRVDPASALETVYREISALYATALASPELGIEYSVEEAPEPVEALKGEGSRSRRRGAGRPSLSMRSRALSGRVKRWKSAGILPPPPPPAPAAALRVSDDVEIIGSSEATADAFAAYFADSSKEADRPVTFAPGLGLAVETPPEGLTLERLWAAV